MINLKIQVRVRPDEIDRSGPGYLILYSFFWWDSPMKIRLGPQIVTLVLLLASLFMTGTGVAEETGDSLLREGHPDSYLVREGDTLWDIASMFLIEPWYWPEIWHVNPSIDNPHLIYPGDEIFLSYVGGDPQLSVKRGPGSRTYKMKPVQQVRTGDRYEKMDPAVRISPLSSAIPAIPLDAVSSLMSTGRIVAEDTLELAPRILAGKSERLIFGPGDIFMVAVSGMKIPRCTVFSAKVTSTRTRKPAKFSVLRQLRSDWPGQLTGRVIS